MAYAKSLAVGIAAAAVSGGILFAVRMYQAAHGHGGGSNYAVLSVPVWVPTRAVGMLLHFWILLRENPELYLVPLFFIAGFWWELRRASPKPASR
jgi:hypothetical protein